MHTITALWNIDTDLILLFFKEDIAMFLIKKVKYSTVSYKKSAYKTYSLKHDCLLTILLL